jgi:hypothetical protein
MPITIIGVKAHNGELTVVVTGQKTPRIEKRWTEKLKENLGCGFSEVSMEWVS